MLQSDFRLEVGHAYMLVSPDDEIVKEFFTLLATTIFCETKSACMHCSQCSTVVHDNHSDVVVLNRNAENIKVETIRDMTKDASIRSLSGTKLYYIHRADMMSAASQNKLLKTLEEPPKGVTIFLGVSNESAMLDTIKSRCRSVYLDVFDNEVVKKHSLTLDAVMRWHLLQQIAVKVNLARPTRLQSHPLMQSFTPLHYPSSKVLAEARTW
jgi:DNA polymerase III gamma/tau subunit